MKTETKTTTDYSIFKIMEGNRPLNEGHILRLMASFQRKYLISPILVNNDMFIIDGQHRYEAAKRLELPVYYRNDNAYTLEDAQILNSNNKVWNKKDYLESYCLLGIKPYVKLKEFMQNYPMFGIAASEIILTGSVSGSDIKNSTEVKGVKYRKSKPFEEGKLQVGDIGRGYEIAGMICEYSEYFPEYNSRSFIRIMVSLFNHPKFRHDSFIKKLRIQPTSLRKCATAEQYRILIEDIYNYKSRSKVNLKY